MVLTGYPVEDLALRSSFVEASAALAALAGASPTKASGTCRSSSATSTAGEALRRARTRPAPRRSGGRAAPAAGSWRATPSTTSRTTASSTSTATSCRATPAGRPAARRRRRARDLRGPVAGRRPGRRPRDPAPGCWSSINGSPYERNKDDVRLELVRRRAAEAGCALAYLNMVGGQDELVFDGDSLVVDAGRRGARARPRSSSRCCRARPRAARRRRPTRRARSPNGSCASTVLRRTRSRHTPPSRRRTPERLATTSGGLLGARAGAAATTSARTASGRWCSASPAASTRRWSAAIACDALGRSSVRGLDASRVLLGALRDDAAELAGAPGCTSVPCRSSRCSTRSSTGRRCPGSRRRTSRHGCAAHADGDLQPGGPPRAGPRQQERARRWAIRRSTATRSARTGRSRTYPRRWCSGWPSGASGGGARGETPPIPENSIGKPPTAELRPGQLDTDSLPDYAVLDEVLDDYVESDRGARPSWSRPGFDLALVERVLRLTDTAE